MSQRRRGRGRAPGRLKRPPDSRAPSSLSGAKISRARGALARQGLGRHPIGRASKSGPAPGQTRGPLLFPVAEPRRTQTRAHTRLLRDSCAGILANCRRSPRLPAAKFTGRGGIRARGRPPLAFRAVTRAGRECRTRFPFRAAHETGTAFARALPSFTGRQQCAPRAERAARWASETERRREGGRVASIPLIRAGLARPKRPGRSPTRARRTDHRTNETSSPLFTDFSYQSDPSYRLKSHVALM